MNTLVVDRIGCWTLCLIIALSAGPSVDASPKDRIGEKLEDVTLTDMDGKSIQLSKFFEGDLLVIAYSGRGCPIAQRYAPRLQKLSDAFASKGVSFIGINANPQDSLSEIADEARQLSIKFPMLQDGKQALTRQLDAKTSTVVFVVDKHQVIRYRGMIDDQYALGSSRSAPKYKYLDRAIKAVLKGKTPHVERTVAPGCLITRAQTQLDAGLVSYSSHIARIVQDNCQTCHRPKQIAPFPLETYEDVSGWSAMIHSVVEGGRMPPWNADHEFDGAFVNQRSMPKKDKELLLAWIDQGMPRGDPAQDPPEKKWSKKWRIGKPDKIYSMQETFAVPKEGVVEYQYFSVKTKFKKDKWIVGMEARPGSAEVVHHILAFVQEEGSRPNTQAIGLDDGFLCATVPGDIPSIYAKGYAKRLPAGSTLWFQMHYTTNGKVKRDKSSLGLIFTDKPVEREVFTRGIYNLKFKIPPGEPNHEVRAEYTLDADTEVLSLYPHMHLRGKDFTYIAHLPDGSEQKLLSVSRYDYNWQESYVLKKPALLPKGTRLECIAHYDNSAMNFANPDPKAEVVFGEQTWDEMMIGYMDYVIPDAPPINSAQASARMD